MYVLLHNSRVPYRICFGSTMLMNGSLATKKPRLRGKLEYFVFVELELLPEGGRTKLYKELALLEKHAFCSFSYYLGHGYFPCTNQRSFL